jgi:hypothetical protein
MLLLLPHMVKAGRWPQLLGSEFALAVEWRIMALLRSAGTRSVDTIPIAGVTAARGSQANAPRKGNFPKLQSYLEVTIGDLRRGKKDVSEPVGECVCRAQGDRTPMTPWPVSCGVPHGGEEPDA